MSLIKSLSVGDGDMFYISHGSDSFTMIDCCISDERRDEILAEIKAEASQKGITRFISTHPDDDHLRGLVDLDDEMSFVNFYCVSNEATKDEPTPDFERYCELRDSTKAFYLKRGCKRRWLNESDQQRGGAGIEILWPITDNEEYVDALADAKFGLSPNNLSVILQYSLVNGPTVLWMGDLETDFMEAVENEIALPSVDVLFAPHHGRATGKVPEKWLGEMSPRVVIIGEAPSEHLDYYEGFDTITQNSAGDIVLDCQEGLIDFYVSEPGYSVSFLSTEGGRRNSWGRFYLGTLFV